MTLTPEMVDSAKDALVMIRDFLTSYKDDPSACFDWADSKMLEVANAGIARAQSQSAVGVEELEALRTEVRAQAGLKDNYQEWDETERMLSALIERAGGGDDRDL